MGCLVCLCFLKNKLCAKMMISLHLELQNLSMRTLSNVLGCTQGLHGMGLIVEESNEFSFGCNMNGIEMIIFNKLFA